jgi:predicted cobalt transporter CbtA
MAEREKAGNRHRQRAIYIEPLGDISDPQVLHAADLAASHVLEAEQGPDERCLAGAIWTDEGHDLARMNIDVDVVKYDTVAAHHRQTAGTDQGGGVELFASSMVVAAATGIMLMMIVVGLRMIFGFSGQRAGHFWSLHETKALSFRRQRSADISPELPRT